MCFIWSHRFHWIHVHRTPSARSTNIIEVSQHFSRAFGRNLLSSLQQYRLHINSKGLLKVRRFHPLSPWSIGVFFPVISQCLVSPLRPFKLRPVTFPRFYFTGFGSDPVDFSRLVIWFWLNRFWAFTPESGKSGLPMVKAFSRFPLYGAWTHRLILNWGSGFASIIREAFTL